jgi:hypothetical protein
VERKGVVAVDVQVLGAGVAHRTAYIVTKSYHPYRGDITTDANYFQSSVGQRMELEKEGSLQLFTTSSSPHQLYMSSVEGRQDTCRHRNSAGKIYSETQTLNRTTKGQGEGATT